MTSTVLPSVSAAAIQSFDLAGPAARILADSVGPDGTRLTTFETVMWRPVLAENNTHKVVAKSAASSRAIPVRKMIANMRANPAFPIKWASEQSGMQGGDGLDSETQILARVKWERHMEASIAMALELIDLGLHKSLTNRLLEPFMWVRVVQTATAWHNFFDLRDHEDAQPEFQAVAHLMREAYETSQPVPLEEGQWHLPYVSDRDRVEVEELLASGHPDVVARNARSVDHLLAQASAARCARTSYLTNPVVDADGNVIEEAKVDLLKDFVLVDRLIGSQPRHWSPFEHQATPWVANRQWEPVPFVIGGREYTAPTDHLPRVGNLLAWRHQRTETEALLREITYR